MVDICFVFILPHLMLFGILWARSLTVPQTLDRTYKQLGATKVVEMFFQGNATSDVVILPQQPPPISDNDKCCALAHLEEMGVTVIVPAALAEKYPLQHAIWAYPLASVAEAVRDGYRTTEGGRRIAVYVHGTEPEEDLATLQDSGAVLTLLSVSAPGASQVPASRRFFDYLSAHNVNIPVIHHRNFPKGTSRDAMALTAGIEIGALLVDGMGDGVALESFSEDPNFLHSLSSRLVNWSREP